MCPSFISAFRATIAFGTSSVATKKKNGDKRLHFYAHTLLSMDRLVDQVNDLHGLRGHPVLNRLKLSPVLCDGALFYGLYRFVAKSCTPGP